MKEQGRGIGAVMLAFGVIAIVLWLAVARLSPETALSFGGISVFVAAGFLVLLGAWFLKRYKG